MMNKEEKTQKGSGQSAVINSDAEFENRDIDPGFIFENTKANLDHPGINRTQEPGVNKVAEQDEQGTTRSDPGLGELEGTNPGLIITHGRKTKND